MLPSDTPEQRAVAAEYAEYLDWLSGAPPKGDIEHLASEIEHIGDAAVRLRLRVSLAIARAKRAFEAGDAEAIDRIAAIRSEIPDAPSYLRLPSSVIVIGIFLVAFMGPVLAAVAC